MGKERRQRLNAPPRLIIFGGLFLALPFANLLALILWNDIPLQRPNRVVNHLTLMSTILIFTPFAVGIGLLLVKKWAWYLLLIYAAWLTLYNAIGFVSDFSIYNVGALIQSFFGLGAIAYFLRPDISAPYMKLYPRGWRMEKRWPVEVDILVDNKQLRTKDAAAAGLYVGWRDCPLNPGDEVEVSFALGRGQYRLAAGITRVEANGVGLAFRRLGKTQKKQLRRAIMSADHQAQKANPSR